MLRPRFLLALRVMLAPRLLCALIGALCSPISARNALEGQNYLEIYTWPCALDRLFLRPRLILAFRPLPRKYQISETETRA